MKAARSDVRDIEIHRLRNTHNPLLAIVIASPVTIPAPRRRRLSRRQGDGVAPRIHGFRLPVRVAVVEDAVRLVELVDVRVETTAVRPLNFVELAVRPASAGRVVGTLTDAVPV